MEEHTSLHLEDRQHLHLTGVTALDRFDEREIVLFTVQGELTVTGRSLEIASVSIETGVMEVEGEIWALAYGDRDRRAPVSLLGRLLR
ncbi:MAG: sporulation protein YabP [Oscillospiraceae bacterium]|nr:sporulation protein YabP [Oscillospiraceae bacterium]